jgi:hypothetical protein
MIKPNTESPTTAKIVNAEPNMITVCGTALIDRGCSSEAVSYCRNDVTKKMVSSG